MGCRRLHCGTPLVIAACLIGSVDAQADERRPNVLFLAIDDLRPALGCYGDPIAITPHIDQLAGRGTVFRRAYCQQAVCSPSRLSLLTGRRPDTIRVWDLKTHFREAIPDVVTLPQHFRKHGYHTQGIGKIYHGSGPPSKDPPSWSVEPVHDYVRDPTVRYALPKNREGEGLKRSAAESADVPDNTYIDGIVCDLALEALADLSTEEKPFFLAVGFRKPHLPFCAPQKYWELYDRKQIPMPDFSGRPSDAPELAFRSWKELEGYTDVPEDGELSLQKIRELRHGYYACVSFVDAQVGRLTAALKRLNLDENTVVVLWGDHGFHLGEQGIWAKANNYELSTRVPLIVAAPGQGRPGGVSDALVELVDVYPTLADLCDLKTPSGVEGVSLVPWLYEPGRPGKQAAFSQYPRDRKANRHSGQGDVMGYAVRTDRYRYVEWRDVESDVLVASELYDHANDPNETRSVVADPEYAEAVSQTSQTLQNGWNRAQPVTQPSNRPNVLFLAVDDMKDWVGCLGGYEGRVHTPNIDRLAEQGMLFSNAHCPSPKCAPSRAAVMTGLRPSTTGLYDNGHWWLPNLPNVVTMPRHFHSHGYRVVGAGKIFHHTAGNNPPNQWDDYLRLTFRNDPWFRGVKLNYPWSEFGPNPPGFPFSGVDGLGHENDWGSLPISAADYDDALSADYAVRFLSNPQQQPFFLACGIFRPHLPWYVPEKFFDKYPLEAIRLPTVLENDVEDVPAVGRKLAAARRGDWDTIRRADRWKQAVRAYLASITFADEQLGRVLDALEASPHADRTVVVLWSDHGWHLGEKDHWHKSTLWEEATRVPLIIDVPDLASGECTRPVSLVDLFPTLCAVCALDPLASHDGVSLLPLLFDPQASWDRPAVIEYQSGNAAVRSDRYRYIRYRDGSEELYDHRTDPHEWHNLAGDAAYAAVVGELARWLPQDWADEALTKKAFDFDPQTFQWTHKASGRTISGRKQ